ncbi:FhaA domain-containing protein [Aeromicrobium sp.]|uniref:FhaA domain-containing protein n=1 Tax=Aeromicrobium sp. TaxID=1871063 RepID=UPI0019A37756|nr:FhaA domain-containing protein [Aeromicrobium sp.]MBC7633026.1 DUF3662 domain-containing protein [Aeromicrobium sp.]
MNGTLSVLAMNLLILVALVAAVVVALRVAQSIFGTGSKRAAATEVAAKLVSYPTGSSGVLRRRFVRALTSQHVIMPSGDRLAFAELTVRVAPEDLERLDPDGDVERLGDDAAKLYLAHARREGWSAPRDVTVIVEVDPGLRSGWVPPARGSARPASYGIAGRRPQDEDASRAAQPRRTGWDVVVDLDEEQDRVEPAVPRPTGPAATMNFPALVPDLDAGSPTMNVASELSLQRGNDVVTMPRTATVVLGRLPESPVTFVEPEVSHRHAAVRLHGAQWQIKDLGSTNGTTVDGVRVGEDVWTPLRSGSAIALAGIRLLAVMDTFGTVHVKNIHLKNGHQKDGHLAGVPSR